MQQLKKERIKGRQQQTEGLWRQFKGRVKEAWGAITDDDLDRVEGRKDQILGTIQEKTGEARADVAKTLDQIADDVNYRFNDQK